MSSRDGGRFGGRGGRGGGAGSGGGVGSGGGGGEFERDAQPSSYWERGGRGGSRGGRSPHPQSRGSASDIPKSSLTSLSRELEEQFHISSTSGPLAPTSSETLSGPPTAAPVALVSMAASSSTPPSSSKYLNPPLRPGFGTLGMKCKVRANHFLVRAADKNIYQYEIKINPEVKSRAICRALMKKLIEQFGESHLGRLTIAYDGRNICYTPGSLPFTTKDFVVVLSDLDRRDKTFNISISLTKSFDLFALGQFLKRKQRECPYDIITALDIILRESPSKNYVTISRSFFSREFGSTSIGEGLECYRGFFQSLRPIQMGLSLNVDISATSFYKPVNLLDFVSDFFTVRLVPTSLSEKQRFQIQKALKGVRVETNHLLNVYRRYKITGITSLSANELMFHLDEPERTEISVAHYFRTKHNYNLKYGSLPCIKAGSDSNPKYLPMEVCKIVDGQRYVKKLNDRQVTEILRSNCKRPADREKSILELVKKNNYNNDMYAKSFSIGVQPNLTTVEARVLSPPNLKYHHSGRQKNCQPKDGKWNMINMKLYKGGTVDAWACISFCRLSLNDIIYGFCGDLVSMCNNIGMAFNKNPVVNLLSSSQIENSLRELHNQTIEALKLLKSKHRQLQLLIVVLPEIKGSYGRIKKICETELGLVTQCCQPKHLKAKANKQYLENLALKINVKVGGCNTVLEDSIERQIPFESAAPTIIFGADVTHPAPGEDSLSSIAAVVASMDWPYVTKYRCLLSAQPQRQEIIEDLFKTTTDPSKGISPGGMIRDHLLAFYRETKQKPHHIIFYRDGVSEGQFNSVLLLEMEAIRKGCVSLQKDYLPLVTFIVVQKRHHTRLFPDNASMADRSGNILPGTVVDRDICHPTEFDFYLCSHAGIQGTSRPVHYHVLYDENHFSADQLQTLTNNLCYTYARCTRSVSVVPAAYYAHLAAFRARYYTEGVSESGSAQVGGATRERTAAISTLPAVKENIMDVMFYC